MRDIEDLYLEYRTIKEELGENCNVILRELEGGTVEPGSEEEAALKTAYEFNTDQFLDARDRWIVADRMIKAHRRALAKIQEI